MPVNVGEARTPHTGGTGLIHTNTPHQCGGGCHLTKSEWPAVSYSPTQSPEQYHRRWWA